MFLTPKNFLEKFLSNFGLGL